MDYTRCSLWITSRRAHTHANSSDLQLALITRLMKTQSSFPSCRFSRSIGIATGSARMGVRILFLCTPRERGILTNRGRGGRELTGRELWPAGNVCLIFNAAVYRATDLRLLMNWQALPLWLADAFFRNLQRVYAILGRCIIFHRYNASLG